VVYRAVVIGCGKIGSDNAADPRISGISTHAGAYTSCAETALVAVCDSDPKKVERCSETWNIAHRFQDYRKMLDEIRPDIVSICTPDETHYDIISEVLTHPGIRAVFAEKPLAMTVGQARTLANLAKEHHVILAVNYSRRYSGKIRDLKRSLQDGLIGEIRAVNGYYTKGTIHNGTHWFDLARFLIGEIVAVRGFDNLSEGGPDPTLDADLEFACGAHGYLHACDTAHFTIFEMDILGTRGRIVLKDFGHVMERYDVAESPYNTGFRSLVIRDTLTGVMNNQILSAIEDVVDCIREGKDPVCSGDDGIAALAIACAVRDSAAASGAVRPGISHDS
jgi:predicted dehydrogenase